MAREPTLDARSFRAMQALRLLLVAGSLLMGCSPGTRDDETVDAGPRLGTSVLIFWGEGGTPVGLSYQLIGPIDDLVATLSAVNVSVTQTGDWPTNLFEYRTIVWYMPGAKKSADFSIPGDRVAELSSYLRAGGRLVVAGDIPGGLGEYNFTTSDLVIDRLMVSLGVNLRIGNPGAATPPTSCTGRASDPLLANVGTLAWNASHPLGVGSPATWLECNTLAIQTVGCGEVVLIGDTQPVSDYAGGNPQFITNLATVPPRTACE